jgi:hypothetical protein
LLVDDLPTELLECVKGRSFGLGVLVGHS